MSTESTSTEKSYSGNCHCGNFKYTAVFPAPITAATQCTCSICSSKGYLWVKPKQEEGAMVIKKKEELGLYKFGSGNLSHFFCKNCGSPCYATMNLPTGPLNLINLHTMKGFDYWSLDIKVLDGATLYPPAHTNPTLPASELKKAPDGRCIYEGSCHCGGVKFEVVSEHLEGTEYVDCNCSVCAGMGCLWIYPSPADLTFTSSSTLKTYTLPARPWVASFCSTCGIHVKGETPEEDRGCVNVNLRLLKGIRVEDMVVSKGDAWGDGEVKEQYKVPE